MSRVDQAGPVSKILHYIFERFVKFSMCSYERAGWLGSRDVGFFIQDLAKRAGKFFRMNTSVRLPSHLNCNDTAIS